MSSPAPADAVPMPLHYRLLGLLSEVRRGEAATALLLALNLFLLLGSYYLLKTIREPLILTQGGAEVKSYAAAGQALLLLLVVGGYSRFAAKANRNRLITAMTLFFISNLLVFYLLGMAGVRIGVAFFLWVGVFSVFIVAQFWGFANDLYSEEQGKRLFPIIGVGSSLGAWVGSMAAKNLFTRLDPLSGPYQMMLIAAAGLGLCIVLTRFINGRESDGADRAASEKAAKPIGAAGGFKLVFSERYLFLIAMLTLMLNVVNTTGGFILDKVITDEFAQNVEPALQGAAIGAFYGDFYSWVNLLGLCFQLFLVSRIFKFIGVRGAMFILPMIALGGYSLVLTLPLLGYIRMAKIFENSTDYSIMNTTRHALFLPTSRAAKYKAKAAIDSFFWRVGDMLQAGIVFVGVHQLSFGVRQFAMVNVALVFVWLAVTAAIARENKRLVDRGAVDP